MSSGPSKLDRKVAASKANVPPAPPSRSDAAVAAEQAVFGRERNRRGRRSTIRTGGQGLQDEPAELSVARLLGL